MKLHMKRNRKTGKIQYYVDDKKVDVATYHETRDKWEKGEL